MGTSTSSTDVMDQEIRDLVKKFGLDLSKIANRIGWPPLLVKAALVRMDLYNDEKCQFTERHGGYGRPEIRDFLVARRRAHGEWLDKDQGAIEEARVKYDKGLSEIATGRDGSFILLYSIPRKKPVKRSPYFSAKEPIYA